MYITTVCDFYEYVIPIRKSDTEGVQYVIAENMSFSPIIFIEFNVIN